MLCILLKHVSEKERKINTNYVCIKMDIFASKLVYDPNDFWYAHVFVADHTHNDIEMMAIREKEMKEG